MGVFGTKYVRDGPDLPAVVYVAQGSTLQLSIPHIYSYYSIGTTLAINLRQGQSIEELPFVHLQELNVSTIVTFDAMRLLEGE